MKGFIINPTYQIRDGKAYVQLYGRLENGESFLSESYFRPYFHIKKSDLKKVGEIKSDMKWESEDKGFTDFHDNTVVSIITDIPSDVPKLRKLFEEKEIECYEADIRFAYRFMMDNGLFSSMDIEGDYEKGEFVDRIYKEPVIKPVDTKKFNIELRTLSIDIETSSEGKNLYSIALYGKGFKKVIFVGEKKLKECIIAKDEREALEKLKELILEFDPDIITGWNVIDFDLNYIQNKFRHYKIPFKIGRSEREASLRIESVFFMDSKASIPGRIVLDGIQLLKTNFYKLEDYKLDTAAYEYLGERKLIGGGNKGKEIEDAYKNNPQKLADYNLKDAKLVYDILEKKGLIELTMARSFLTGMPLDRVQASVASFDSLYLRELLKIKKVASSAKVNLKEKGVTGGYVMKSKAGIYDNVIVCDFKSLYPSIIRTFNIDPIAFAKGGKIKAPNGATFDEKEGLLPLIIERMWKSRDEMKKRKDDAGSYAIKIHMNSIYGVTANPSCRFYSYDFANAITTFGQMIIKTAAEFIMKEGYEVIYGDTDSIFVNIGEDSDPLKAGKKIQNLINDYFKSFVKKYNRENRLEMEFEKVYKRFLMPYVRGGTEGAKKRYAGLLVDKDGNEKMDFTGMEFVRRDWTDLSKKFQLELLNRIFNKEEVGGYVREFVKKLREGKYDTLLVYRKSLSKGVDEYVKTTPPHVKAARILEDNGMLNSSLIEYIMTANGPEPVSLRNNSIDYEHYIEKQIKPLADAVLVFYDKKFEDLIGETSQSSLFEF